MIAEPQQPHQEQEQREQSAGTPLAARSTARPAAAAANSAAYRPSLRLVVNFSALLWTLPFFLAILFVNLNYGDHARESSLRAALHDSVVAMRMSLAKSINTSTAQSVIAGEQFVQLGFPFPNSSASSAAFNAQNVVGGAPTQDAQLRRYDQVLSKLSMSFFGDRLNSERQSMVIRFRDGSAGIVHLIDDLGGYQLYVSTSATGGFVGPGLDSWSQSTGWVNPRWNATTLQASATPLFQKPALRTGVNGYFWNLAKTIRQNTNAGIKAIPDDRVPIYTRINDRVKGIAYPLAVMSLDTFGQPFAMTVLFLRISDYGSTILAQHLVGGNATSRGFLVDHRGAVVSATTVAQTYVEHPYAIGDFVPENCFAFVPAKMMGCFRNVSDYPMMVELAKQRPGLLEPHRFIADVDVVNSTQLEDDEDRLWDVATTRLVLPALAALHLTLVVFTPADLYSAAAIQARNVAIAVAVVLAVVITAVMFGLLTFITTVVSDLAVRMENPLSAARFVSKSSGSGSSNDSKDASDPLDSSGGSTFSSTSNPASTGSVDGSGGGMMTASQPSPPSSSPEASSPSSLRRRAQSIFTELVLVQTMFDFTLRRIRLLRGFVNATAFKHLAKTAAGQHEMLELSGDSSHDGSGNSLSNSQTAPVSSSSLSGTSADRSVSNSSIVFSPLTQQQQRAGSNNNAAAAVRARERRVQFSTVVVTSSPTVGSQKKKSVLLRDDGALVKSGGENGQNEQQKQQQHQQLQQTRLQDQHDADAGTAQRRGAKALRSSKAVFQVSARLSSIAGFSYAAIDIAFPVVNMIARMHAAASAAGDESKQQLQAESPSSTRSSDRGSGIVSKRSRRYSGDADVATSSSPEHALMMVTKEAAKQAHTIVERSHVTTVEFFGDELLCCFRLRPTGRSKILVALLDSITAASFEMEKNIGPLIKQQQQQQRGGGGGFDGVFIHAGISTGVVRPVFPAQESYAFTVNSAESSATTTSAAASSSSPTPHDHGGFIAGSRPVVFCGAIFANSCAIRSSMAAVGARVEEPEEYALHGAPGASEEIKQRAYAFAAALAENPKLPPLVSRLPYAAGIAAASLQHAEPDFLPVVSLVDDSSVAGSRSVSPTTAAGASANNSNVGDDDDTSADANHLAVTAELSSTIINPRLIIGPPRKRRGGSAGAGGGGGLTADQGEDIRDSLSDSSSGSSTSTSSNSSPPFNRSSSPPGPLGSSSPRKQQQKQQMHESDITTTRRHIVASLMLRDSAKIFHEHHGSQKYEHVKVLRIAPVLMDDD